MAVYAITGKLGTGKGKCGIRQLREYLKAGRRVATNCDVFLDKLMPLHDRSTVIRLPDKPKPTDLYMIGSGNKFVEFQPNVKIVGGELVGDAPEQQPKLLKGFDESENGALILDECGSWLNTRDFQDKGRAAMLEWVIHARKYGWDIFFIMQNISQVDKQLRDSVLEYVVRMNRLDRMKIPVVSAAIKGLTAGASNGNLMRCHIAVVRLGCNPMGLVADRWVFRGDDLNDAYNTAQVFTDKYPHGTHSLLSRWHLEGYKSPEPVPVGVRIARHMGFMLPPKKRPARGPQSPALALIAKLPADERMKHFKRLQEAGAL